MPRGDVESRPSRHELDFPQQVGQVGIRVAEIHLGRAHHQERCLGIVKEELIIGADDLEQILFFHGVDPGALPQAFCEHGGGRL